MKSWEEMDRLGILLDAEWEMERIEKEKMKKKQAKKDKSDIDDL